MKCFHHFKQIATLNGVHQKDGRNLTPDDLDIIENASIVFDAEKIHWVGASQNIPAQYKDVPKTDYSDHVLLPELIDSHTHLVFGGNRAKEYTMRLNGADYQKIADEGGGILATMEHTITASADELFQIGLERINRIAEYGIKTIEIKSGYGLTVESERKISQVIHRLKRHFSPQVQILNTYLAAHAVPGGFKTSGDYLDKVVIPLLRELAQENIIDFVDIFHEQGYFNLEDSRTLFNECKKLNIATKIHADEFNDNGGASLAAEFNAASADHLLQTGSKGIKDLASSDTVATLLPGTAYFLGKPLAPARKFLDAGCKVSLASDYNPGSCHCDNVLLIASIAAKSMGLNSAELWSAITYNAAAALQLNQQGALISDFKPRFAIFKCQSIDEITYNWGRNLCVS